VVIDCEYDREEKRFREMNSARMGTAETILFLIDSDFWFFLLLDFSNKIDKEKWIAEMLKTIF